jgi:hypothetical protein
VARTFTIPRRAWTLSSRGGDRQNPSAPILFVHYSGSPGKALDSWSRQAAAIRAIRDYHVDVRGWLDIGYSYVLTQPAGNIREARIWRGRGRHRVPASQEGYNTGNLSVCVITDGTEVIPEQTVRAIAKLARRVGARDVQGHRDVNATSCPGEKLAAHLPRIRALAGLR